MAGGGTRSQVYGSRTYGSGYPGITGAGVAGRGFPFYFWPVVWGGAAGVETANYLHDDEYGHPNNTDRPGGPMAAAAFVSNYNNTIFRVVSDNATIVALISDVTANCSSSFNAGASSAFPSPYGGNPGPEKAIQYYRASSVMLAIDGYNNSAVYSDGASDSPLPSNVDTNLLNCLNQTIGLAAPLIDGASMNASIPNLGLIGLIFVTWNLLYLLY
ncbi:hypothetical protein H0H87_010296 [Tephrocybe sp. NHM501043]|nr:hypothetical protein H0H87_010296 [Tephrocybe sp. NHM501043]